MIPYTAHDALNAMAQAFTDETIAETTNSTHGGFRHRLLSKLRLRPRWLTAGPGRRQPLPASGSN